MQKQMYASFIFCFFLLSAGSPCNAQNIDSLLSLQRNIDPQEKVYVHFDKNYYNPGETIWFKAYLFAGLERSVGTKTFYADLIDEGGNIIKRFTGPVAESSAAGSFELAPNISKNVLFFRAYTASMLNGDSGFIYTKPIRIVTPTAKSTKPKTAPQLSIAFLPEGGDLIANMKSKLAFKVSDVNGLPATAKGYIKSNDGTKVADFVTVHDGMGAVDFTPQDGKSYTAIWKDENNKEYTSALPVVKQKGVSLQVSDIADGKKFVIERSEDIDDDYKALRIIAFMNQQLVYFAKVNLTANAVTSGVIPTKQLPSGILQVTVFDKNFKPLEERVCFVNNHDYEFDVDAWIPAFNKSKRGLNTVEVLISDTFRTNLSLSITDADIDVPQPNEDNIVSHLLLTGDLRGKIANPYYYFFSTSDSVGYYLDLVMLTHGWRRYNWEKVMAGKLPSQTVKDNNYLSIDGTVIGSQPGRFPPDTKLTGILQTKDSSSTFLSMAVDKNGKVLTDGLIFYDFAKLYFQFSDKKLVFDKSSLHVGNGLYKSPGIVPISEENKNLVTSLDSNLVSKNLRLGLEEIRIAAQKNKKEQVLQEVIVKGKVKTNLEKMDEKYASSLFSGGDSHNFDVANDPFSVSAQSVFQYLAGKVAGLQISDPGNGATPSLSWRGGTPVFYLNEVQSDVNLVSTINVSDIAYIKVFSPGTTGVISSSGGGAIVIYTKKGTERTSNDKAKGLDYVQLPGYTLVKQFYSPDYATSSALNDLDDIRTTLYWNPYILLDKSKKRFKVQFYNNDITHRFRIVLEGINANDKFTRVQKVIE